jgi:hypothetical protein
MWLYHDFSGEMTMIVYALENVLAIVLAVVFVLLFAPRRDEKIKLNSDKMQTRRELLQTYVLFGGFLSFVSGLIMMLFIFGILKTEIAFSAVTMAVIWIFGFQILEFIGDFIMLRPLALRRAEGFLTRSLGRIALLFLCVFLGLVIAFLVEKWFVLPFIILKTIVDIGEQIQIFTGFGKPDEELSPLRQTCGRR